jgi:hypothetical protein
MQTAVAVKCHWRNTKWAAAWLKIRTTSYTLEASFIYGNSSCFCVQKSFLAQAGAATSENVGDL